MAGGLPDGVQIGPLRLASMSADDVVCHVVAEAQRGRGGRIVTPNVDLVYLASRDPEAKRALGEAEIVVADGVPLLWVARVAGTPLPGRVAGSDLVWRLAEQAARTGLCVYLLGGPDGVAARAAEELGRHAPGLKIVGQSSPRVSPRPSKAELEAIREELARVQPNFVFCAFGSPKQEHLMADLAPKLPRVWWLGCGAALSFVAGENRRAPAWMQRNGLEWLHRLSQEPMRLGPRYLGRDLIFLLGLFGRAARERFRPRGVAGGAR